nr:hypothetical protein CFP56_74272 [Quercus suber]
MERNLWGHLPLLMRSNSKESVEYILQALWRTRKIGLDLADRHIVRNMLQLENDSDLDPLLVCLRMLIRRLLPRLNAMTWDMANQDAESIDPVAVINLKVSEEYLLHLKF